MLRYHARLVTLLLGTACIALLCTSSAFGQVTYDAGGCTRDATANSIFTIKARWIDTEGLWPIYLPFTDEDYGIQPDPSQTFYNVLAATHGQEDSVEIERDIDDTSRDSLNREWISPRPGIRLYWDDGSIPSLYDHEWGGDAKDIARFPYLVDGDPLQNAVGWFITPANCAFGQWTFWPSTTQPSLATVVEPQSSYVGYQTQVYIPRHYLQHTYTDADNNLFGVTIEVPPVIVPRQVPVANINLFLDEELTVPYTDFAVVPAASYSSSYFCRHTVQQFNVDSGTWGGPSNSTCQEPLWVFQLLTGLQDLDGTAIIVLDPFGPGGADLNGGGEGDNPDPGRILQNMEDDYHVVAGTNHGSDRVYVTYTIPGPNYVVTPEAPLPAPETSYQLDALNSLDGSVKVKMNTGVVGFDPNRTDPNDADSRYPEKPGVNSPILGLYLGSDDTNYFVPGKYTDEGNYGQITIDEDKLPEGGIDDWTDMTLRVSTHGVDAVWTRFQEYQDVRRPRRINYFRTPEWLSGVVTSKQWNGPGANRPPSAATLTAYTVTPDTSPNALHTQSVTGVFLPQLMSGTVYDDKQIIPAFPSRVGMVLGVYALSSQPGDRYDDMHVSPKYPESITFVSAVYARDTMFGTPVDSKHVNPDSPSDIRRVVSVKVLGQSKEYYDAQTHPWTPGDTTITLSDAADTNIPPGTSSVIITYETTNLYDAEDPALAYNYQPASNPMSRLITLTSPLPPTSTSARIVYGVGTGLDGFNYYDPNNSTTTFRPGDPEIILRQSLPSDVTDVRILYGTDTIVETRGSAPDANSVVPPNIWRVGRVEGVYAVLDQPGTSGTAGIATQSGRLDPSDPLRKTVVPSSPELITQVLRVYDSKNNDYYGPASPTDPFEYGDQVIKLDKPLPTGTTFVTIRYQGLANTVIPSDSQMIRKVLGVFAVDKMQATVVDDTHVAPALPLSIRADGVRGVYAVLNQQGAPGSADGDGRIRTVIPSDETIIGKVNRVYDEEGTDYFDPYNPETVFRPGDPIIKLSDPLGEGVSALTINYETINLISDNSFVIGSTQIELATPLPQSTPIDAPIRVEYVSNLNCYNVNNPVKVFNPKTDTQIMLNRPLPVGTVDIAISYAEAWNRYRTLNPASNREPDYAPGESDITLFGTGLPTANQGAVVEYTGHLFPKTYNPLDYNPDDSSTHYLRPFIPGDTILRLNRLKSSVELPEKFTGAGALKLCIAYQSDKNVKLGDYTQAGRIDLPIPLPVTMADGIASWFGDHPRWPTTSVTPDVYVDYRLLTSHTGAVCSTPPKPTCTILTTYTLGRPRGGKVMRLSFFEPEALPDPLPTIDEQGKFRFCSPPDTMSISATYRRMEPDQDYTGHVWVGGLGGKYQGLIPLYIDPRDGYNPIAGVTFRGAVSAGLNLSNVKQQPSCNLGENETWNTNQLIFDPRRNPMWYAPTLRAEGGGAAHTYTDIPITAYAYGVAFKTNIDKQNMTVHDSRPSSYGDMINHAGMNWLAVETIDIVGGRDYLVTYPFIGHPDPLIPEPADEINTSLPDDGSSSTEFVFRARYMNADGLSPQPWLPDMADPWNWTAGASTGVVLYLDEKGTGDYQPHFMRLEDPTQTPAGAVYIYRLLPHHMIGEIGTPWKWPWPDTERTYESLACGVYHYFFGCSDDLVRFDTDIDREFFAFEFQPDPTEWGEDYSWTTEYSSTGLDPSAPRNVTGFSEINRPEFRRYSTNGNLYDSTIHVDRFVHAPGMFGDSYPLGCDFHPKVTCDLSMPEFDDLNITYDDAKYGYGRFFGTLDPFYRAINPLVKDIDPRIPNDPIYHGHLSWAETCGATSQTDNVFRIMYKQIDNKPPIKMQVYINNASYKSSGTSPSPSEYTYATYSMYPRADQGDPSNFNYREGVWYEYKTKLSPGPHTYYFQADDGEHIVRFPVRPDKYIYDDDPDVNAKGYYMDGWIPTGSLATERANADYIDNDYISGPYVNHPCVLSEAGVTPGTGKEGESFKYRVKYADADGQRPFTAYVFIETNSRGDVRRLAMRPEKPFSDPSADHSADYIKGVYYVLDTGTIKDLALENGVRRFYFEFIDDWGPYQDLNETIQGELTRSPQGAGNWVTGPVISGNRAPTLYQGSVASQDGTANAATLWTFKVNYRDLDNDEPALAKVYIGLLQPDGSTMMWDEGHTLQPSNPSDNVYSDGAEMYFQTRLGAADEAGLNESKQYFYAFEAYDGIDWASFLSSSNDELRSNAAGCMVLDDLERVDSNHYLIRPKVVQQASAANTTEVVPDNAGDILRVWGVYLTEDLAGASDPAKAVNYYSPSGDPPLFTGSSITLTSALATGVAKVWVQYEPQAPIVGPLPIDLPAPSGVIPDALIYEDYSSVPTPILIDDQKNGWINPDTAKLDDRGVLRMRGVAVLEGQASVRYVTPDSPRDIASVEGVYTTPDFGGENYYDPSVLEPVVYQSGTADATDATRKSVIPENPDGIAYVTGVFDAADPTGTNYFMGTGYPNTVKWQEALIVGNSTVWPKNPNDIVSVKGIYLSSNDTTTNYYRSDNLAVQRAYAYDYLAQPGNPGDIKQVLGIFLTQSDTGTNYYNSSAPTVPFSYGVTPDLPSGTITVYIKYTAQDDSEKWQGAFLYVGSVMPDDIRPIGKVLGSYLTVNYEADGKPTGVGTNYSPDSSYVNGNVAVATSPVSVASLGANRSLYLIYETLASGFGPYNEYMGVSKTLSAATSTTAFIAYYPRATLKQVKDKKYAVLTKALPAGVSQVNVRCFAKAFNCGDSIIPLTKSLPEGTQTVWIKYSDIRYTHQLRGMAQEPMSERWWSNGTTHYSPDGWDAGSSEELWTPAAVLDPLTVSPQDGNSINTVLGVYLEQDTTGVDYYVETSYEFFEGDSVIRLATALPAGVGQVWVNFSPRNVHFKSNSLDETGMLSDVTSGAIGVWLNASRDGTNYFDPRGGARHPDNVKHLRLTTLVPDGTDFLWARYYQKGDYHLDRWNRDLLFVTGKEKAQSVSIQASYFFGTKMPQMLVANTPPTLTQGKINKLRGSRSDQYIFSVTYRDMDGPNGQAPVYIRLYVDGKAYDMNPVNQGTPPYREGAVYTATPTEGLAGGSHKFHFEASDGASVALYDWYDENNQTRPTTGDTILDIDGPWVNNPPELSDGKVEPNPAAGISPSDSVDFSVVYTDADNDEPYFHDAVRDTKDIDSNSNGILDGVEYSGSPRIWVDSGVVDQIVVGTVSALEDDPMEPGKKRTIVVTGATGWTTDQFAGKLLQITNGVISGRVYLIQSNTDSRLVIATDSLSADGVKTSADPTPSAFRINGLLMSKADPTQQDFTGGIRYKLTVPKLAVGDHKFHFTARSRETKPQWLLGKLTAAEKVPYSIEARNPASGDSSGPKVISTPPPDNIAPSLSNTADTSVYAGPVSLYAVATSLNQVEPTVATGFATVREVRGVFANANDFVLASVADDDAKTYYDPKTASTPFRQGDTKIVLTRTLPALPDANMVQFGDADVESLSTVTPNVAGVIDTVLGVYLASDPTLAGTNYFRTLSGGEGTFSQSTGKITLGQPLPSGTRRVFVRYEVTSGLTWTSTPAVPVYVKYYSTTTLSGVIRTFQASDLAAFRINYKDPNGDPPSYHDGVQGYVKVVFNDLSTSKAMQILNWTGASVDYTNDVLFTTEPMNLPEGTHRYHFEASDGYVTTRFPTGSGGNETQNDYTFKVNYKPLITSGRVDPTSGQAATQFRFTATYKDQDGPGENQPQVYARITRLDGTQGYTRLSMSPKTVDPKYASGVEYELRLKPEDANPPLTPGQYKAVFEATDGDNQDAVPYPTTDQTQLTFTIRDINGAPVLSGLAVTPVAGKLNDQFYYKATYSDPDGDAPVGKVSGKNDELTLVIDKGLSIEQTWALTKAPSAPASPTVDNYKEGVLYQSAAVSGKKIGAGHHTYEVSASDGTASALPVSASGPVLLIPYFENFRAVDAAAINPDTAPAIRAADVGKQVIFVGEMKFPDNPTPVPPPVQVTNITILVTKPDATTVSLTASYTEVKEDMETQGDTQVRVGWVAKVTAAYPTGVDPSLVTGKSLTLTSTGNWVTTASWPGDSKWDKAEITGNGVAISVGGPMRTVAVADPSLPDSSTPLVDMITPPKMIGSTDIGRVFGYDLALDMQIVRWDAGLKQYLRYGTEGGFPDIHPGEAIWIKPRSSYPAETVSTSMVSDGLLALGNPEVPVNELAKYRLIKPFVRDYDTVPGTSTTSPCVIALQSGWNQFGTIFFNWKKNAGGAVITPKQDLGIPISELQVRHLGETKSLAAAAAAGWIRDYAWRYDAVGQRYVMVHPTAEGAERTIIAWSGYWIRAFNDCDLIINPTTTYSGAATASANRVRAVSSAGQPTDAPPPMPE